MSSVRKDDVLDIICKLAAQDAEEWAHGGASHAVVSHQIGDRVDEFRRFYQMAFDNAVFDLRQMGRVS